LHTVLEIQSSVSVQLAFWTEQLKTERESGVFRGWNEGKIFFAPTYKYSWNSDSYAGEDAMSKKKRRTPAWYVSMSSDNKYTVSKYSANWVSENQCFQIVQFKICVFGS
jgi:hypothetical protein